MDSTAESLEMPRLRAPGERIDRFEIISVLGSGGMGVVYAANDPQLDRTIALKLVRSGAPDARERLVNEARAMAKLSHPNVVSVFDAGAHGDDVWIAMEWVTGGTLAKWIRSGRRSWRELVARFVAAGEGLANAHDAGLVHRDFKPENVLVRSDGRIAVADFGLARFAGAASDAEAVLSDEEAVGRSLAAGTPTYMSPEQHVGRGAIDARSDQFSFCVAFWEALFGQRPFAPGKDHLAVAVAVITGAITPPVSRNGVPSWLIRIIKRGLATDPAARWPSMRELLAAISQSRRRRRVAGIAAVSAVAMAASAAVAIMVARDPQEAGAACDSTASAITATWSPRHAAQVRAQFAKSTAPYAAEAAERVIKAFDTWTRDWQTTRVETCRARSVTREIDETQLAGRVACLDEAAATLDSRVRLLTGELDDKLLARALDVARLEDPAVCKRDRRIDTISDPVVLFARDRMRAQRLGLEAELAAGRYTQAYDAAKRLRDEPRHPALEIEAALLDHAIATVEVSNGKYAEAIVRARRAAEALTARGDDRGAAKAWLRALDTGVLGRDLEGVDVTLAATRGAVQRANQPDLEVMFHIIEGRLATLQNRPIDGEVACLKARRVMEERAVKDEQRAWLVDECLVRALDGQGKHDASAAMAKQSLARTERSLPQQHPRLATTYHTTGATLGIVGQMADAKQMFERALAIRRVNHMGKDFIAWEQRHVAEAEHELGETAAALAHVEESLALALEVQAPVARDIAAHYLVAGKIATTAGEHAKARRYFDEAIGRFERLKPGDFAGLASALHHSGRLLAAQGKCRDAIPLIERAIKTRMQVQAATAAAVAEYEVSIAQCSIALGKPAEAIARMEQVLETSPGSAAITHVAAFTRESARWAGGDHSDAVLAAAREARTKLAAAGEHRLRLAEMDKTLARMTR